jgi:hypothetical protein
MYREKQVDTPSRDSLSLRIAGCITRPATPSALVDAQFLLHATESKKVDAVEWPEMSLSRPGSNPHPYRY